MTDYSICFIIAVAATGVGALLFLLSLFGLGEHDLDFDADAGGADVRLLSIHSGLGFFLGFGWGGVLAQGLGWGMALSLIHISRARTWTSPRSGRTRTAASRKTCPRSPATGKRAT